MQLCSFSASLLCPELRLLCISIRVSALFQCIADITEREFTARDVALPSHSYYNTLTTRASPSCQALASPVMAPIFNARPPLCA
ncbi:hypothetical protein BC834DRAFT_608891 [Gloeopeniophorella convolvens]|nr:hypothetical protein BC834DRAFT_608891 [Gloeopeniophorella convolvens]